LGCAVGTPHTHCLLLTPWHPLVVLPVSTHLQWHVLAQPHPVDTLLVWAPAHAAVCVIISTRVHTHSLHQLVPARQAQQNPDGVPLQHTSNAKR
jgi:hypothetical protein